MIFHLLLLPFFYTLALAGVAHQARQAPVAPGSLQQVTDFGDNPSNVGMFIYVPNNLAPSPGIIVAIHYCSGTAEAYFTGSPYATLAETHGFIVIYPESPYEGTCWDVSSSSTLTANGGGNSNSIANMVAWTTETYKADTKKVFVTGTSSGAMMTNVMAATYPSLFTAATVYSGVAAGCFVSEADIPAAWNSTCAQGQSITTPEHWAAIAQAMAEPGYSGSRPRMQIYHGGVDETLLPPNYNETCKQWSGVFGYDFEAPASVDVGADETTTVYGDDVVGIFAPGVGHSVEVRGDADMQWFGFV
ncbi:poly depolymerase [Aspergillus taichungensis]|uniref:Carboxylic ester hydrolase n=1 Tax=Aspergillus taichungensis TaxID=482145 RepID=A0A2J5I4S6_9EURO|nr:poly depolymerase [Aspergillus taichungensis]